jgi:hypothetical protein
MCGGYSPVSLNDAFLRPHSDTEITVVGAQLTMRWSDATVVVHWLGEGTPVWEPSGRVGDWVVRFDRSALAGKTELLHRWELTLH